jgi:hypothetical protein
VVTWLHPAIVRSDPSLRLRNVCLLGGLVLWMLYTRFFWVVQTFHATLPPCPFLTLTGHPCPFCGGTRSYAYMWQGDAGRAAALYPLGPVLFWATLAAIPMLALALVLDRDLRFHVTAGWKRALVAAACAALAVSWALKLTLLPN